MKLTYHNTPELKKFDHGLISERPVFLDYHPDFVAIDKLAQKYKEFKNIIVIGHGGSITTFEGMYYALQSKATKQAFFISTVDPDAISVVMQQTSPSDTVVVAISKSGQTVTQLEALSQFFDYPIIAITGAAGPLADIAHLKNADVLIHPPIGGRYTGLTEVALLPAALCGLDAEEIFKGGQKFYNNFGEENEASKAASTFYELEEQGIVDVFMPFYSTVMFPFANLIVQLCHESFGKNQKGQTYFAHEAPESQHHTNQRFFGGRKNIAGWFITAEPHTQSLKIEFPNEMQNIAINDQTLGDLNGVNLSTALQFEKEGTIEDAKVSGIPIAELDLGERTERSIGEFIALWQLYAVYASVLREVNPFDQPQVENSKKISFAKRLKHTGKI